MGGCFIKRFFYYFGSTVVIGFIIYLGSLFQVRFADESIMDYKIMPVVIYGTIFPVLIGLLLRLPKLIIEIKQNKQWTFDWVKFIGIGLPSFYIIAMSFLPFAISIKLPEINMLESPTFQIIAGVVFGYILLDSLKK
ncbi:hypothetical protein [Paraliobacillus zengyii]|uniref:hypothetical protein n=2 Tax=Paraliobacillus zengyii TaxID=2213194 RepID=UPI000DD2D50E|nr:hypothetical protein [Paraliobacillus zengyii]